MSNRRTTMRKWMNCWSVSPRWNRNWKARKARCPLWMTKWHSWRSPMNWRQSTWADRTAHSHLSDRRQSLAPCRKPERTRLHLSGAYFMICIFCIYLIFSMVFIDYQLFNFYKFSSVLMVFTQNVVDLL